MCRFSLLIFASLLCAVSAGAQATDCNDPTASAQANAMAQQQWQSGSSPVFADATALAKVLKSHSIQIQCIRRSKEENLFPNQKGAAWFQSEQGIFEVWFLMDTSSATSVMAKVTKSQQSGSEQLFIQHGNMVFHINASARNVDRELERRLADTLRKAYAAS